MPDSFRMGTQPVGQTTGCKDTPPLTSSFPQISTLLCQEVCVECIRRTHQLSIERNG